MVRIKAAQERGVCFFCWCDIFIVKYNNKNKQTPHSWASYGQNSAPALRRCKARPYIGHLSGWKRKNSVLSGATFDLLDVLSGGRFYYHKKCLVVILVKTAFVCLIDESHCFEFLLYTRFEHLYISNLTIFCYFTMCGVMKTLWING